MPLILSLIKLIALTGSFQYRTALSKLYNTIPTLQTQLQNSSPANGNARSATTARYLTKTSSSLKALQPPASRSISTDGMAKAEVSINSLYLAMDHILTLNLISTRLRTTPALRVRLLLSSPLLRLPAPGAQERYHQPSRASTLKHYKLLFQLVQVQQNRHHFSSRQLSPRQEAITSLSSFQAAPKLATALTEHLSKWRSTPVQV